MKGFEDVVCHVAWMELLIKITTPYKYEFNASPETVFPIFDGPVGSVLYATILLPPCF